VRIQSESRANKKEKFIMKRKVVTVGLASAFIALLAYGAPGTVNPAAQSDAGEAIAPHLVGTWRVTVTPPPGGPPQYISVGSYMTGGVFITSPDPSVGPGVTSTGQGTWERTGGNQFASSHVAFTYDSVGHITGTIRIKASYQLTGKDSFEGTGQLQFCDLAIDNCFTPPGCPDLAVLRGERMKAEPPSCSQ
jgi:hypothetical protein